MDSGFGFTTCALAGGGFKSSGRRRPGWSVVRPPSADTHPPRLLMIACAQVRSKRWDWLSRSRRSRPATCERAARVAPQTGGRLADDAVEEGPNAGPTGPRGLWNAAPTEHSTKT